MAQSKSGHLPPLLSPSWSFNSLGYTFELQITYGIVQNLGVFLLKNRHPAVECQRVCTCHFLAAALSLGKQS